MTVKVKLLGENVIVETSVIPHIAACLSCFRQLFNLSHNLLPSKYVNSGMAPFIFCGLEILLNKNEHEEYKMHLAYALQFLAKLIYINKVNQFCYE